MKKILVVLFTMSAPVIFSFAVSATEIESEISEKLFSSFSKDVLDALEQFGITDLDYEKIFSISFESIINYYKDVFTELFSGSFNLFVKILSLVITVGFASMILQQEKYKGLLSALSVMVVSIFIVDDINLCISSAVSLLKLNGNFMISFVPIYAGIIALSGNPSVALTYNSLVLGFAETSSALINYGLIDLLGCFFCLSTAFSVSDEFNFSRLLSFSNRLTTFVLGLVSSVFASLLSIKGVFSSSADSVASKGIRFAIGSLVPVIGSSISEAYSAILGSINIIKSSVAIIGIFAILIINLPIIIEIILFYFSLSALGFISELLDCREMSNVFKGFSYGIKILGLLCVFEMFVLIVSTAVMLSFKGG